MPLRRLRRRAAWSALAVGCAAAVSAQDWPQYQHDARHSGHAPVALQPVDGQDGTVAWRWHPDGETSIAGRVQPVVAEGLAVVGFLDGRLWALDARTGEPRWSRQAGGPILHSAAIVDGLVVCTSHDGSVTAFDVGDGTVRWRVDTGAPLHVAPCVAGGRVFVGNAAGRFVALQLADGEQAWEASRRRPILTTAAVDGSRVFAGDEGLWAFCLDAEDGALRWEQRLWGQSLSVYAPVVVPDARMVFYRSQPAWSFHRCLGAGDRLLAGGESGVDFGDGTPAEVAAEAAAIRDLLRTDPSRHRTCFALDAGDGRERFVPAVLYTAGEGSVPAPPVFDPAGEQLWIVGRSRYARWDSPSMVRRFGAEPLQLDLENGDHRLLGTAEGRGSGVHLIGDETSLLSVCDDGLLVSGRGTLGWIDRGTGTARHLLSSQSDSDYAHPPAPLAYGGDWPAGSVLAGGGSGGAQCAAAAVADGAVFWLARWGLLVRFEPDRSEQRR